MTSNATATMNLVAALEELAEHVSAGIATPDASSMVVGPAGVQYLPTSQIATGVEVFQPRSLAGQIGEEYVVMGELEDALTRNGVERFDPVIVWWSGKAFFCVDGHHRLEAIKLFNKQKRDKCETAAEKQKVQASELRVPVTILKGTLSEATVWSTRENGKARIALKKRDRSDWAWKQGVLHWGGVLEGKFVMAQRCKDLHVSDRLLKQMRAVFKRIVETEQSREHVLSLAELGWAKAKALSEGRDVAESWDEDKREAEVQKAANEIISKLGAHRFSATRAEITAEAIMRVSERFLEFAMGSPAVADAVMNAAYLERPMGIGNDEAASDY